MRVHRYDTLSKPADPMRSGREFVRGTADDSKDDDSSSTDDDGAGGTKANVKDQRLDQKEISD